MEVILLSKNRKIQQKIEQELYWYDSKDKSTFHERGGRLEFYYDAKLKRSLPKVVDHYEMINGNDYPVLKAWVDKSQQSFNFDVVADNKKNIIIEVNANNFESLSENLKRHNITHEYCDREYKKEIDNAYSKGKNR